jgi:SAM-dependent methyltransferase
MSDWQERITHETAPSIRAEHDLRYVAAAPLILAAGSWADLGCGNGIAAAAALGAERPRHAVLVDVDPRAVELAAAELLIPSAATLVADLTDHGDLEEIGRLLLAGPPEPVVTCFEVVEHLSSFLALLEWAGEMTRAHRATFLISVPNDAFWSIQNPHHLSAWGEGAFEELRRLLPAEQTLLRQVALSGSALVDWDAGPATHPVEVSVGGPATVATHFLAAFGPRHGDLARSALAVQSEMLEQRRWERQRESDLARSQRLALEQQEQLQERTVWFEEWRKYIHELERELKRPLSGVAEDELPSSGETAPVRDAPAAAPPGEDAGG